MPHATEREMLTTHKPDKLADTDTSPDSKYIITISFRAHGKKKKPTVTQLARIPRNSLCVARAAAEQTRGGLIGAWRRRRWLSPPFVYDLFTSCTHQSAAVLQEHEPIGYEVEPAGLYRPPRPKKTKKTPAVRPLRRSVVTLRAVFSFKYRKVPVKATSCAERSILKGLGLLNHPRHNVLNITCLCSALTCDVSRGLNSVRNYPQINI